MDKKDMDLLKQKEQELKELRAKRKLIEIDAKIAREKEIVASMSMSDEERRAKWESDIETIKRELPKKRREEQRKNSCVGLTPIGERILYLVLIAFSIFIIWKV